MMFQQEMRTIWRRQPKSSQIQAKILEKPISVRNCLMPLELVETCYRTCRIQEIVIGTWFFLSNPELSQEISLV